MIDASAMHVAPGFVDLHTHYDAQVFWDPYLTLRFAHGGPDVPPAAMAEQLRRFAELL